MISRSTWFSRCNATIFAKCCKWIVFVSVALAVPAFGQDQMVLGPRQYENDKKGAVLCTWSIYLAVQEHTAFCKLVRRPVDNAIDQAIREIDDFILTNSSLRPTRAALEDFKGRAAKSEHNLIDKAGQQRYCENPDYEFFRAAGPDSILSGVKRLLETPREPVMNPCL